MQKNIIKRIKKRNIRKCGDDQKTHTLIKQYIDNLYLLVKNSKKN